MQDYSNSILEAMKYVDKKIENLNPESLDRDRLKSKIAIQITANIKKIANMNAMDAHKEIDNIWGMQLLEEISRHI